MPRKKRKTSNSTNTTGANLGFEARLWAAADALRNNMDAAEYKHVVLGLIFLKYISDAFEEYHAKQPTIGQLVDDGMVAIERDNPSLKGVLPKDYARAAFLSHPDPFVSMVRHSQQEQRQIQRPPG